MTAEFYCAPECAQEGFRMSCRLSAIRNSYGLSKDTYFLMIEEQSNRCKICGATDPSQSRKGTRVWSVDHDHTTGKVRGLICHRCNNVLRMFNDDWRLFLSASIYLSGNQS
jgi:hypothetical protein